MTSHTKIDIVHGSVILVSVLPACGLFVHELWRVDIINDVIKCAQDKISDQVLSGDWITYILYICHHHHMSYTQNDYNNALSQILDSFGTLLADLENVDKKDRQKIFEVLVDHIVAEIQIIANTKFKLGTPNYIDSGKLEETKRRFYNFVGYSFKDSS